MLFKLVIEDDEGHTTVVPLVKEEITIGRKEGNTIRLTERNVSRHHARLTRSNGSIFIEDLDSYNGVKVNGDKITARTTVREGDLVEIGDYHLALQKAVAASQGDAQKAPGESPPPVSAAQARAAAQTTQSDGATAVLKLPVEDKKEEAAGRVRTIPEKEAGRLVVTNTELSGKEYPLVRTEMTIGRTEDNDIVIAHRSISSCHAKIVFDGGIYRIIDMDSANGILVNGEEYARVDLRRGDTVELGHVRIRYTAPGEKFDAPPPDKDVVESERQMVDASAFEQEIPKAHKGKLFGIVAVIVVVLGAAVGGYIYLDSTSETTQEGDGVEPVEDGVKTGEPVATKKDPAAALFKEAMDKYERRDYDGALAAFDATLEANPDYPGVGAMVDKVEQEKTQARQLAEAKAAMGLKDWDKAWQLMEEIPDTSRFSKEIDELKPEVKKKYILWHLNKASISLKSNLLDKAHKHVDSVLLVDEGNTKAMDLRRQIKRRSDARRKPPDRVAVKKTKPGKHEGARRKKEIKELVNKGNRLYKSRKFSEAVRTFKRVIQLDARNCDALVGVGVSYAASGNGAKAAKFYRRFVNACPRDMRAPQARKALEQFERYRKGQ